ncbi:MAG: GNAT family N-acetyltransferase, partial [Pseudomonadota bacterium]
MADKQRDRLRISDIRVEEASIHDADLVTIMVSELLRESFFTPAPVDDRGIMEACNSIFEEDSPTTVLIAFSPTRKPIGVMTIGTSAAIFARGKFATIMEIYVSPNQRSLGIGQALMDYAKELGQRTGWQQIMVAVPTS